MPINLTNRNSKRLEINITKILYRCLWKLTKAITIDDNTIITIDPLGATNIINSKITLTR